MAELGAEVPLPPSHPPRNILFIKYSFFVGTRNFETEIQNYKYIRLCACMGKQT